MITLLFAVLHTLQLFNVVLPVHMYIREVGNFAVHPLGKGAILLSLPEIQKYHPENVNYIFLGNYQVCSLRVAVQGLR